jgi:hypothetical protein
MILLPRRSRGGSSFDDGGSPVVRLRVAVVQGLDGAAASKDEQDEEAQQEGLERVQLTATGIGRVGNGAADVAHSAAVLRHAPPERKPRRALRVRARAFPSCVGVA